jgi:predicted amidohydrolase YtcJ
MDQGALVTNGTDVPVEDINPLESFYASVTRKRIDNGMEFYTNQKMTRKEAIHSYTLANAYAAFEEGWKGSIEEGKCADLVMLSNNLLECQDSEILETKVLMTVVDGNIKYSTLNQVE